MTINLGNFQTAGSGGSGVFVLDGNGGVALRPGDQANTLTEQDNRNLKNAFLAAVTAEYDGLAAMEALRALDSLATPLTTETYAQARLALTDAHRLLLDGDAVRGQIRTELEGRADLPAPIEQLAEQVRGAVDALALPPSAFTLARAVDRVLALRSQPTVGEVERLPRQVELAPRADVDNGVTIEGWTALTEALRSDHEGMGSPAAFFRGLLRQVDDEHHDWYTNFVVLNQFADGLDSRHGDQAELQSALRQRSVGYLYKYATPDTSLTELQTTPLTQRHVYHRTGGQIADRFRAELDLLLGFHRTYTRPEQHKARVQETGGNVATAYPVSSRDAFEVAKLKFDALGPGHTVLSPDSVDVATVCTAAIKWLMDPEGGTALIDISNLVRHDGSEPYATALKRVQDELSAALRGQLEIFAGSAPNASERVQALLARLETTVGLIDMTMVGAQPVLTLATLSASASLNRVVAFEGMTGLMSGRGMNAGPQQILENWSRSASPARIHEWMSGKTLTQARANEVTLPATVSRLHPFGSFEALRNDAVVRRFGDVVAGAAPRHPLAGSLVPSEGDGVRQYEPHHVGRPYIHQLGGIMLKQLQALPQAAFDAPGRPVLEYLCNRIVGHLENALAAQDSQVRFLDHMHLVNEEITTALTLLRPYDRAALDLGLPTLAGPRPDVPGIAPRYAIANGGMNALSMVLSGVQAQKGSASLNVLMQRRSYYEESAYAVGEIARYRQFAFDGRDAGHGVLALQDQLAGGAPLDLFVAEFHHNVTTDDNRYAPENVAKQVQALLASDPPVLASPCTIAIDTTMNLSNQSDITGFLMAVKEHIDSGRLNVVLFRSGQKFDMGGMDHLNAGLMATYNNPAHFERYNGGTREAFFEPSRTTLQGMLHLETHARVELDSYRQAIANANRSLTGPLNPARLPRALIALGNETTLTGSAMLQLAPSSDPNAMFLDIRSPISAGYPALARDKCLKAVMLRFQKLAVANDLPCGDRPSFGFPHLNISDIVGVENAKLRLTLGLEPEAGLVAVRDILVTLDMAGRLAQAMDASPEQMATLFEKNDAFFTALLEKVRLDSQGADPLLSVDDAQILTVGEGMAHDAVALTLAKALRASGLFLEDALPTPAATRLLGVQRDLVQHSLDADDLAQARIALEALLARPENRVDTASDALRGRFFEKLDLDIQTLIAGKDFTGAQKRIDQYKRDDEQERVVVLTAERVRELHGLVATARTAETERQRLAAQAQASADSSDDDAGEMGSLW